MPRPVVLAWMLAAAGLVLVLVAHVAYRSTPWFPADDAYISFRYADNWASGEGPVFNPGERVEGYSNFLFVLLLKLCAEVGLTPPLAARALNGGAVLAMAMVLLFASPGRRPLLLRLLAATALALVILHLRHPSRSTGRTPNP